MRLVAVVLVAVVLVDVAVVLVAVVLVLDSYLSVDVFDCVSLWMCLTRTYLWMCLTVDVLVYPRSLGGLPSQLDVLICGCVDVLVCECVRLVLIGFYVLVLILLTFLTVFLVVLPVFYLRLGDLLDSLPLLLLRV